MSSETPSRRWLALAVLALAQFMVVLDATIVNVALPSIRRAFDLSPDSLQWVLNAYVLAFGGMLLLGGRVADVVGRRRMFLAGLALFTAGSLAGGLAGDDTLLIAARAAQGLGAAFLSPAALSSVTSIFPHGRERNTALGVWGALAGLGGTLGVVAGGLLVESLGWEWVFFVNVPFGVLAAVSALRFVPESRDWSGRRSFDVAGALAATGAALTLVYAVIGTTTHGWGSTRTLGLLAVAGALTLTFLAIERRTLSPLLPLRLLRSRSVASANASMWLTGATFVSMFFLSTLTLQEVLGMSALTAGVAFLPMGATAIASATLAPRVVGAIGVRRTMAVGTGLGIVALWLLSHVHAGAGYASGVLPGLALFGVALPLSGVPATIAAVAEVDQSVAGVASGLVNAAQQIGGAVGLAAVTAIATTHTTHLLAAGTSATAALADGFARGYGALAIVALANFAVVNLLVPDVDPAAARHEAAPAPIDASAPRPGIMVPA